MRQEHFQFCVWTLTGSGPQQKSPRQTLPESAGPQGCIWLHPLLRHHCWSSGNESPAGPAGCPGPWRPGCLWAARCVGKPSHVSGVRKEKQGQERNWRLLLLSPQLYKVDVFHYELQDLIILNIIETHMFKWEPQEFGMMGTSLKIQGGGGHFLQQRDKHSAPLTLRSAIFPLRNGVTFTLCLFPLSISTSWSCLSVRPLATVERCEQRDLRGWMLCSKLSTRGHSLRKEIVENKETSGTRK